MSRNKDDIQPIMDSPENVALAIMQGKPKKKWRYLERRRERKTEKK